MDQIAITFDVDWAPEFCIERCLALCLEKGIKATFFATHFSSALHQARANPLIEIGIHPNFLAKSSHGQSVEAVMRHCLAFAPDARAMRTHALVQSSPLLAEITSLFPAIETDVSLLLPLHPYLQPTDLYFGEQSHRLTRLPFFWEDDVMAEWPGIDWQQLPPISGLSIFNFHPVLVEINMSRLSSYRALKATLGNRPLTECTRDDLANIGVAEVGCRNFLERLIEQYAPEAFWTVSEITDRHRGRL